MIVIVRLVLTLIRDGGPQEEIWRQSFLSSPACSSAHTQVSLIEQEQPDVDQDLRDLMEHIGFKDILASS